MDEFPTRHGEGPDYEPESRHGLIIGVVVASAILALAGLYFYGFSRTNQAPDQVSAPTPAATDTEVAVEPAVPAATDAGVAGTDEGRVDERRDVATPPDVVLAEPEPPAPAPVGQLVVRSNPTGALVTVDGTMVGTTPVTVDDLAFGTHDVQVARPGFVPAREQVDLAEASPSRTVNVTLRAGAETEAPRAGPAVGALDVDSRPRGATVRVDGRRAGVTPLRLASLAVGTHVVELELSGYRVVRAEVTVERGRSSRLAVTLEPSGS